MMETAKEKLILWVRKYPIVWGYMTCMAMFGNGVRTGIMIGIIALPVTDPPGFHLRENTVFCGAVRGSTYRRTVAVLFAATDIPVAGATTLAFVSVWSPVLDTDS